MSRNFPPWIPFLLCALVAGGCLLDSSSSGSSSGPDIQLVPGDTLHKSLSGPAGKTDTVYIVFAADSGHRYRLQASDSASQLKLAVTGLDSELVYTSAWTDFAGKWTMIDFPCTKSGTYLLRIVGPGGLSFRSAVQAFDGLPSSYVGPDPFEIDSSLHLAKEVAADGNWNPRTGTSSVTGDVDWIFFRTLPGHTYTADFHDSGVSYGTMHGLWTKDSTQVGSATSGSLSQVSFDTGRIYLRVECNPSGLRYRLRVTDRAGYAAGTVAPDDFEQDDSIHPATLKPDSALLRRTFHGASTSHDTDWTQIDLPAGGAWTISVVDSTSRATIDLLDPSLGTSQGFTRSQSLGNATLNSWTFYTVAPRHMIFRAWASTPGAYTLQAWASGPLPDSMRLADPWEPDSPTNPVVASVGGAILSRTLHGAVATKDTDWTAFGVDSGRTYQLVVFDSSSRLSASLTGIPGGMTATSIQRSSAGTLRLDTFSFPAVAKGRVVLATTGTRACGYSVQAFSHLGLPDSLLPEIGEPDDLTTQAYPVALDAAPVVKRVFGTDSDWVSLSNLAGTGAVLRIANLGSIALQLRPGPGSSVRTINPGASDSVQILTPAAHRVLAQTWSSNSGYRVQYSVQAATVPLPADPLEPDDNSGTAAILRPGSGFVQRWVSLDDTDWMSFDIGKGQAAKVVFATNRSISPAALSVQALNPTLSALGTTPGGSSGDTTSFYVTTSGRALLRAASSTQRIVPYSIRIDTFTVDSTEPDGSIPQARSLSLDTSWKSTILTTNDTDWFSFPVHKGWFYKLETPSRNSYVQTLFEFGGTLGPMKSFSGDSAFKSPGEGTAHMALVYTGTSAFPPSTTSFRLRFAPGDSMAFSDSSHPVAVQATGAIQTHLLGPGDAAWLSIPVVAGNIYSIENRRSNNYVTLYGWFAGSKVITSGFYDTTSAWMAPADGILKLDLETIHTTWSTSADTLSFSVHEYPANAGAPNHDSASALELPTDSTVVDRLMLHSTSDYFKFRVDGMTDLNKQFILWVEADVPPMLSFHSEQFSGIGTIWSGPGLHAYNFSFPYAGGTTTFSLQSMFSGAFGRYKIAITKH